MAARQQPELDRLARHGIGAGDHGLAGDHGGDGGQRHQRDQRPGRGEQEERVLDIFRMGQDHGGLAEIVEQEAGEDEAEPGGLDRPAPEMTEIGVERLAARRRQEHRAERQQAEMAVLEQEGQAVDRVEGDEHAGIVDEVHQPQHAHHEEP